MIYHKIVVNGATIDSTSIVDFQLTEMVNDATDITIGSACSAMLEFSFRTNKGLTFPSTGDKIKLWQSEDGSTFEESGEFNVSKVSQVSQVSYKVVAYDNVSLLDKDVTEWFNGLKNWPISLYTLTKSAIEQCGLAFTNAEIPNGSYMVDKFDATNLTARTIVRWASQASGMFCRADKNGNITFDWYKPGIVTVGPSEKAGVLGYYMGSFRREPFNIARIDKVQVQLSSSDVGTIYPPEEKKENAYKVTGNYLLSAKTADSLVPVAQTLFEKLKNVEYTPASFSVSASLKIKVGDIVKVSDPDGKEYTVYVMKKSQSDSRDSVYCTGNRTRSSSTAVNSQSFKALAGKVLEIKTDVEGIKVENRDAAGKLAAIELNVDKISSKVLANESDVSDLKQRMTEVTQTAGSLNVTVSNILQNGVDKVTTSTGYTFNKDGLNISKQGEEMKNKLDNTGMYVTRSGQPILTANNKGVEAVDVTVKNFLIIGDNSRFEDFDGGTACFYIGGGA